MDVSRRQGLLALATAVGTLLLKASPFGRLAPLRSLGTPMPRELTGGGSVSRRRPSRSVEPDPHSVKRHA